MASNDLPPHAVNGLLPAQAGVVVDRGPRPAHIVATMVDLAQRGWLEIQPAGPESPVNSEDSEDSEDSGDAEGSQATEGPEDTEGSEGPQGATDWVFTRTKAPARWGVGRPRLARYERSLLRGIFGRRSQVRSTRIVSTDIGRVYRRLLREALAQGWLVPGTSDTGDHEDAERLREELRALRARLTGLRPPPDMDELAFYSRWLPYAIAFGLNPAWAQRLDVLGTGTAATGVTGTLNSVNGPAGWWTSGFGEQMTSAVGDWSHHSAGTGGHFGGGHDHGGGGHHGGGHHGGYDGGGGGGGGGGDSW